MLSFKRRGVVDFADPQTGNIALRAAVSLSFNTSTTPDTTTTAAASLKLSFEAPVFLFNEEAKASLTRAQRVNSTFNSIRPRIRLALALHIHPSSIISISFSRLPALPDHLVPVYHRLAAGPSIIALQLKLASPPVLVAPNIPGPLVPATRTDLDILKAFQNIASSSTVTSRSHASDGSTITFYLPAPSITDEQASSLCTSISPGAVEAAATPSCEQSLELQLDGLFGGLGARLVPLAEVAALIDPTSPTASPSSHSDKNLDSSPPSYDISAEPLASTSTDTGTAPPPPSYQSSYTNKPLEGAAAGAASQSTTQSSRQNKRQRLDSAEIIDAAKDDEYHDTSSLLHALRQQTIAAHQAIARLETLQATAHVAEVALEEAVTTADAKIAELAEASTVDHCREDISSQQDDAFAYINDRMDELRQELVELLDDRLDTFGLDVLERCEVEELVEAHVDAAVKELKERLASSGVRVLLS